jgi:hypothetical protein
MTKRPPTVRIMKFARLAENVTTGMRMANSLNNLRLTVLASVFAATNFSNS